jgi:hypothetical protein
MLKSLKNCAASRVSASEASLQISGRGEMALDAEMSGSIHCR